MAHQDYLTGLDGPEVGYTFGKFVGITVKGRYAPAKVGRRKEDFCQAPGRWEGGSDSCGIGRCEQAAEEATNEDQKVLGF